MGRLNRAALGWYSLLAGTVLLAVTVHTYGNAAPTSVAAKVNGEAITLQELQAAASQERVGVLQYYVTEFGAQPGEEGFWDRSYNGRTPRELLAEKALRQSVEMKVQQLAAMKAGIQRSSSYEDFLDSLRQENDRRREAVLNQQVIYGPKQYGEAEYYRYTFTNMVTLLKEALAAGELAIRQEELHQFYEEHKEQRFRMPSLIRVKKLVAAKSLHPEEVKEIMNRIQAEMNRTHSLERAVVAFAGQVQLSEHVFNEHTYKTDAKFYPELLQAAYLLQQGELSEPISTQEGVVLLECLEHQDLGFYPLDAVVEEVRNRLLDQKYEDWLAKQVSAARVEIVAELPEVLVTE